MQETILPQPKERVAGFPVHGRFPVADRLCRRGQEGQAFRRDGARHVRTPETRHQRVVGQFHTPTCAKSAARPWAGHRAGQTFLGAHGAPQCGVGRHAHARIARAETELRTLRVSIATEARTKHRHLRNLARARPPCARLQPAATASLCTPFGTVRAVQRTTTIPSCGRGLAWCFRHSA